MPRDFYFEEADKPIVFEQPDGAWLGDALKNIRMKPIVDNDYDKNESVASALGRAAGNMASYGKANLGQNIAHGSDYWGYRLAGADPAMAAEEVANHYLDTGRGADYDFPTYVSMRNAFKEGKGQDPDKDYAKYTDSITYNALDPSEGEMTQWGYGVGDLLNKLGGDFETNPKKAEDTYRTAKAVVQGAVGHLGDSLPELLELLASEAALAGVAGGVVKGKGGTKIKVKTAKGVKAARTRAANAAKKAAAAAPVEETIEVVETAAPAKEFVGTNKSIVKQVLNPEEYKTWALMKKSNPTDAQRYFMRRFHKGSDGAKNLIMRQMIKDRMIQEMYDRYRFGTGTTKRVRTPENMRAILEEAFDKGLKKIDPQFYATYSGDPLQYEDAYKKLYRQALKKIIHAEIGTENPVGLRNRLEWFLKDQGPLPNFGQDLFPKLPAEIQAAAAPAEAGASVAIPKKAKAIPSYLKNFLEKK